MLVVCGTTRSKRLLFFDVSANLPILGQNMQATRCGTTAKATRWRRILNFYIKFKVTARQSSQPKKSYPPPFGPLKTLTLVGKPAPAWLGLGIPHHHCLLLIEAPKPARRLSNIRRHRRRALGGVCWGRWWGHHVPHRCSTTRHLGTKSLIIQPLLLCLLPELLPRERLGRTPDRMHHPRPAALRLGGFDHTRVLVQARRQLCEVDE